MGMSRKIGVVSGFALGLAMCVGMSGQTATKGEAKHMSIREVHVQRVTVIPSDPFDTVVARMDAQIGHPDMVAFRKNLSVAHNETEMEKVVDPVTKPNDIMEFARFDLGEILRKERGADTPRILRIVAGNPLIMKEMVRITSNANCRRVRFVRARERMRQKESPTRMDGFQHVRQKILAQSMSSASITGKRLSLSIVTRPANSMPPTESALTGTPISQMGW
jgi:hypothetical protein